MQSLVSEKLCLYYYYISCLYCIIEANLLLRDASDLKMDKDDRDTQAHSRSKVFFLLLKIENLCGLKKVLIVIYYSMQLSFWFINNT